MKTTTKKLSDTKVEIKVTLDAADLKAARERAVERLAANVKVQGFRKGKAPASMVEQQLSPNDIAGETIDIAVRMTMPKAFDELKQAPIAIEKVDVTKYVPDESAEYTAKADVLPDVKLGDFNKLKTKPEKTVVSDKDVQEIIDNITKAYAEKKVVKRAAKLGDEVIIDFVGKKDGEAFPGGTANDHHLTLGSGEFIPGFEDGIVGHEAGDKFDLEVTFPKDYPEKTLAGQKTVFETLVKQVNEVVKPEENDELAAKCGNFKTMDELRADIRKNLEMQNSHRANEQYRDALVKELVEKSKVAAPEILVQDQLRFIKEDVVRNAASYGMKFEEFVERAGQSIEEWEKSARELAEARVKASLVLQILAKEQKIEALEEEVEAKIAELRDVYHKSKEALANLKKPEARQDIRNRLVIDKTMDFLVAANGGDAIMNQPAKKAKKTTKTSTDKAEKAAKPKATKAKVEKKSTKKTAKNADK